MNTIYPSLIFHVMLPNRVPNPSLDFIDGNKVELLLALSNYEYSNEYLKIILRNGKEVIGKLKKVTFWCPTFAPVAVNIPLIFELEIEENRLETLIHDNIDAFERI